MALSVTCDADYAAVHLSESSSAPPVNDAGWQTCAASMNFNVSSGDATKTVYMRSKDAAGNISSASAVTMVLDQTLPTLVFTTAPSGAYKGGASFTLQFKVTEANITTAESFSIDYSTDSGANWTNFGSVSSTNGPLSAAGFSYGLTWPSVDTDQFKLRVTGVDRAGNAANPLVSSAFAVDSTPPTISGMALNNGATTTGSNYVSLDFDLQDNLSAAYFCPKYNTTVAPTPTDGCWTSVSSPAAGSHAADTNVAISDFDFTMGFGAGSFTVNVWAKDAAGNISTLGPTAGVDSASINYDPGAPPTISSLIVASQNLPANPPTTTDLAVPSGSTVYVRWRVTDDNALPATPIALYYYDNSTSTWDPVTSAQTLINGANGGCTADDPGTTQVETGCYQWSSGSPTSSAYQLQLRVTDSNSMTALTSSAMLNAGSVVTLAGNTDPGVDGSARGAIFRASASGDNTFPNHFVVTPQGTIFYFDTRGVFRIASDQGLMKLYIPASTSATTGVGGPVTSAVLRSLNKIVLDHQGWVYFSNQDGIYKFDPTEASPTLQLVRAGNATVLAVLPNGLVYYTAGAGTYSTLSRLYSYDQGTNTDVMVPVSGTSSAYATVTDISVCTSAYWGFAYDLDSSALTWLQTGTSLACDGSGSSFGYLAVFDPITGVSKPLMSVNSANYAAHPEPVYQYTKPPYMGMDGKLYLLHYSAGGIWKLDEANKLYTRLTASGRGYCPDGVTLASCNMAPQDLFVDRNGKMYVQDEGRIRVVQDDGTLFTLYGAWVGDGDGGAALAARMDDVYQMALHTNGKILFFQTSASLVREFSAGGNIERVLGNGNAGSPAVGGNSSEPLYSQGSWGTPMKIHYDVANENIYFSGRGNITKYDRTNDVWSKVLGTGTGSNQPAAGDGLAESVINFASYTMMPLGIWAGKLMVQLYNPASSGSSDDHHLVKNYDLSDNLKQSSVGGAVPPPASCANNGTITGCNFLPEGLYLPSISYDAVSNNWFAKYNAGGITVARWNSSGTLTAIATTGEVNGIAYRRISGSPDTEVLYYCNNSGVLRRRDITAVTETTLTIPSLMKCAGNSLIWDAAGNRVIFAYTQNGLWGIAEYQSPP